MDRSRQNPWPFFDFNVYTNEYIYKTVRIHSEDSYWQHQPKLMNKYNSKRDAISQGTSLKKLRDNTEKLEQKDYASASVYGVASVDVLIPLLVARIKDTNLRIKKGKTGVAFKEIRQYLQDVEPEAAACIASKVTFDKVFSVKEDSNLLTNV